MESGVLYGECFLFADKSSIKLKPFYHSTLLSSHSTLVSSFPDVRRFSIRKRREGEPRFAPVASSYSLLPNAYCLLPNPYSLTSATPATGRGDSSSSPPTRWRPALSGFAALRTGCTAPAGPTGWRGAGNSPAGIANAPRRWENPGTAAASVHPP